MNLLINPSSMQMQRYCPPPLGLMYIAAMDDNTVIFNDAEKGSSGMKAITEMRPDVVGVSFYTKSRHNSLDYLRWAKSIGATTVAGGPHIATSLKQMMELYSDVIDYFVVGDGELAWQAICNKEDLPNVIKMRVEDLDSLPLPAWDQIDISKYSARVRPKFNWHRGNHLAILPRLSITLGRGCTGKCAFCSAWWVNGKPRKHGKGWMSDYLKLIWELGGRHFSFLDDCLTDDREAVLDLCDVLEPYNFSWVGTTRADRVDFELAKRMAEVGCYLLAFGIETGSQTILDRMNKDIDLSKAFEARDACHAAEIHFRALIMKNYPGSTPETDAESARFFAKLKPDDHGSVGATWVLPGTALYQECKRAGLINDEFWLGPEPHYIYKGGLK